MIVGKSKRVLNFKRQHFVSSLALMKDTLTCHISVHVRPLIRLPGEIGQTLTKPAPLEINHIDETLVLANWSTTPDADETHRSESLEIESIINSAEE